ncbi:hypothetical protein EYR38_003406 [Pleurotus pulmonarius]|nr:hypothetical protein EYR38_003406 [Pleurotus pulmonarius]
MDERPKNMAKKYPHLYSGRHSRMDYNVTGHHSTALSERPERSRNAKAQARHRAKRKAYIEQLEQTVTKLQTALGFSPDQVAALPPPLIKIKELEQENARLQRENDEMRRMLSDPTRNSPMELTRRTSLTTYQEARACDRDFKRRKTVEDLYLSPTDPTPHNPEIARPPPLTIPQTMAHNSYSSMPHSGAHSSQNSAPMFSMHASSFQMPDTPSGSSSTSSPPFSPAQMQQTSHSPVQQRSSMPSHQYYGSVKMEEDNYAVRHQGSSCAVPDLTDTPRPQITIIMPHLSTLNISINNIPCLLMAMRQRETIWTHGTRIRRGERIFIAESHLLSPI